MNLGSPAANGSPNATEAAPAGRLPGSRLAAIGLFAVLYAVFAPSAAFAQGTQMRLALLPVGQPGSYFDLAMQPGETRSLAVDIGNDGQAAVVARTYRADVYTIINGGFGARLRDEPISGTTAWLAYPTSVMPLSVGGAIRRTFTLTVPTDAGPGEYITRHRPRERCAAPQRGCGGPGPGDPAGRRGRGHGPRPTLAQPRGWCGKPQGGGRQVGGVWRSRRVQHQPT